MTWCLHQWSKWEKIHGSMHMEMPGLAGYKTIEVPQDMQERRCANCGKWQRRSLE